MCKGKHTPGELLFDVLACRVLILARTEQFVYLMVVASGDFKL